MSRSCKRAILDDVGARLKEFDKTETEDFFAPCADATVAVKPFQCQPEPRGLTWRDFR